MIRQNLIAHDLDNHAARPGVDPWPYPKISLGTARP
jgi:hypothetical protein